MKSSEEHQDLKSSGLGDEWQGRELEFWHSLKGKCTLIVLLMEGLDCSCRVGIMLSDKKFPYGGAET